MSVQKYSTMPIPAKRRFLTWTAPLLFDSERRRARQTKAENSLTKEPWLGCLDSSMGYHLTDSPLGRRQHIDLRMVTGITRTLARRDGLWHSKYVLIQWFRAFQAPEKPGTIYEFHRNPIFFRAQLTDGLLGIQTPPWQGGTEHR